MSFSYGDFFRVLEIDREPDDKSALDALLAPDGKWDSAAKKVKQLITASCKSIVVENNYVDEDYRSGFARYYYLAHHDIPKRCTRLHLFASPITYRQLFKMSEEKKNDYLGYIVIRPLAGYRLGRSFLSTKLIRPVQPHEKTYLTCRTRFRANLAGNEIDFIGVPWMQQDSLVSACASAALWVASTRMATAYATQYKTYCTPIITDMATRYNLSTGRPMPSQGLRDDQMMAALREMGYEPVRYLPGSTRAAKESIYKYVESEIPVIIGIEYPGRGGHVVTAVGHLFDENLMPTIQKYKIHTGVKLSITRTSEFVPRIIVQDDAGGPFRFLELIDWNRAVTENRLTKSNVREYESRYSCPVILDRGANTENFGLLKLLIVPFPNGVMLDGYQAEDRAMAYFSSAYAQWGVSPPKLVVFRTFLYPSNSYKSSLEGVDITANNKVLIEELRRHVMSKWIWITEISDGSDFVNSSNILGQIIQDSASHVKSYDSKDLIAMYLHNLLILFRPDNETKTIRLPENARLPRLIRE